MGRCCKHLPAGAFVRPKGILPQGLILPVQVAIALSLLGNMAYALSRLRELPFMHIVILGIHLFISWTLLKECRMSKEFYRLEEKRLQREKDASTS